MKKKAKGQGPLRRGSDHRSDRAQSRRYKNVGIHNQSIDAIAHREWSIANHNVRESENRSRSDRVNKGEGVVGRMLG